MCDTFYLQYHLNAAKSELQRCKLCGGMIKPDIIFFGEKLRGPIMTKAQKVSNLVSCIIAHIK